MYSFLIVTFSVASHAGNADEAIRAATKAAMEIKPIKKMAKKVERAAINMLPVDKDTAAIVGSTAMTLVSGRISTREIKNLQMDFAGGKLRPDIEYKFDGEFNSNINYQIDW